MTTNVLIVTSSREGSVDSVLSHLEDLGGRYFRLNTDQFPDKSSLSLFLLRGRYSGNIHSDSLGDIDLKSIDSVWYRKPMPPDLDPSLGSDYRAFIENEVRTTLWSLYTTLDVFWVNPPLLAFYLLEDNKLYQLRAADSVGLIVPDTIISNRHADVLRFVREHGGIAAIKSLYSCIALDLLITKSRFILFIPTRLPQMILLVPKKKLVFLR